MNQRHMGVLAALAFGPAGIACDGFPDSNPQTNVVIDNRYPPAPMDALVVYDAVWQVASFKTSPIGPGASSSPQAVFPSSGNTAYVVLAPGWVTTSTTPPTSFIVLESRSDFSVALGDTLHILVNDLTFQGHCAAGSRLTQEHADFLTQIVFAADFMGLTYDASTCATTPMGDSGAH